MVSGVRRAGKSVWLAPGGRRGANARSNLYVRGGRQPGRVASAAGIDGPGPIQSYATSRNGNDPEAVTKKEEA